MTKSQVKATTRQPRGTQASKPAAAGRVVVENVNVREYASSVDAALYNAMKQALLKALPAKAPGLTQAERFSAVGPHLPADQFPGGAKAGW